ncbi:MAG: translocation/assembly module TamB domain-containing protein, partial [Candidatus Kapaibacterium sp.]
DDLQSVAEGSFDLSPNSTFTFYQPFNISKGTITFRRDFGNPEINIIADYTGRHFTQSGQDDARIELTVTGTKDRPILTANNYEHFGDTWEERSEASPEAAKEDAIYFLATGQFKSDLSYSANTNVTANILQNLGAGLGASVLNNLLGSTSQQIALQSATLNIGGSAPGGQITAAYRNITFKIGGYTYTSGAAGQFGLNLTTDIPLSSITTAPAARNMTIEIQGNSNPTVAGASALTQQPIFLAKWVWTFWHW